MVWWFIIKSFALLNVKSLWHNFLNVGSIIYVSPSSPMNQIYACNTLILLCFLNFVIKGPTLCFGNTSVSKKIILSYVLSDFCSQISSVCFQISLKHRDPLPNVIGMRTKFWELGKNYGGRPCHFKVALAFINYKIWSPKRGMKWRYHIQLLYVYHVFFQLSSGNTFSGNWLPLATTPDTC